MLKFKTLADIDLQKIYAIKEQGNKVREFKSANANVVGGARTDLVMPHDSYIVGLSSLKSEEEPKPEVTGMQVIDASAGRFKSIFNLYSNKVSGSQLQMLNDKRYLKSYENAIEKVLNLDVGDKNFEVRSIKIPALHVEAIWLHKVDNEESDLFTPVKSMGLFEDNKTYNRKDFFDALKNAAANFDLNDNLIGG